MKFILYQILLILLFSFMDSTDISTHPMWFNWFCTIWAGFAGFHVLKQGSKELVKWVKNTP